MLTVIMMAGLPCAGKSTLARSLAESLEWHLIDKDEYRVELIEEGAEVDDASNEAYELSFKELHRVLIDQRRSVIFDTAALLNFILDRARLIIAESAEEVQLKVILCVVDRQHQLERLKKREDDEKENKKRGNKKPFKYTRNVVQYDTLVEYQAFFKHLPLNTYTLDTHLHSPEKCVEMAIVYVNS